jgi:glycosyltransferase involved in cell wall biosynthesis
MNVSVIICTWNRKNILDKTLNHFSENIDTTSVDWELVVVNNNSTDNTGRVVRSFKDSLPIVHVYEPVQGLARAHNTGIDSAQGELIIFTDDDVQPVEGWIEEYWRAYQKRQRGYFFGGPIISQYEGTPPDADLARVAPPSVVGLDLGEEPREIRLPKFIGPNWACPAKYLEQVGDFNENLGLNPEAEGVGVGEETDMMIRLIDMGINGWYVPGANIKHRVPKSKCTLEHAVSRSTAGMEEVYAGDAPMPFTILGIPVGLCKGALRSGVEWVWRKVTGRWWKEEYASWIKQKKMIESYYKYKEKNER